MRWSRIVGFIGLMATLVVVMILATRGTRRVVTSLPSDSSAAAAASLGAPPPANVASDPHAARRHVEQQQCLASCAMEARTCESVAEDDQAESRCRTTRAGCEARCGAGDEAR